MSANSPSAPPGSGPGTGDGEPPIPLGETPTPHHGRRPSEGRIQRLPRASSGASRLLRTLHEVASHVIAKVMLQRLGAPWVSGPRQSHPKPAKATLNQTNEAGEYRVVIANSVGSIISAPAHVDRASASCNHSATRPGDGDPGGCRELFGLSAAADAFRLPVAEEWRTPGGPDKGRVKHLESTTCVFRRLRRRNYQRGAIRSERSSDVNSGCFLRSHLARLELRPLHAHSSNRGGANQCSEVKRQVGECLLDGAAHH